MTHARPSGRDRRRRHRGFQRRYLLFWVVGTGSAVLASFAGTRGLYMAGGAEAQRDGGPAVLARPSGLVSAPPSRSASPSLSPSSSPSPSPSSSRPAARRTPPKAEREQPAPPRRAVAFRGVDITAPRENAEVNGRVGVVVRGRAGDLDGSVLRLFVLAYNGLYYLIDNGPVVTPGREWSFLLKPIGGGTGDIGRVFTVFAVTVAPSCRRLLDGSARDPEGNITFSALPSGCRAADRVNVLKTGY
ncbi:hypothetical protein [Actinomadura xylanilytica]|uniref:hypothetical protein n=1 Tax=Actinomadura xylanilytica TaxID=887459 RepID=UPI00255B2DA5|nr:hypothetical protein [Actinomadura xylanilytica]MDL4771854.1 hypothetical protein [Actinomadura xylanilytica]